MKRLVTVLLIFIILFTSVFAMASMDAKLEDHWSKDYIEKEFIAYYFPYLARDSFSRLAPREDIMKRDIAMSLASLSTDYDIETSVEYLGSNKPLTREEIVVLIGSKLIGIEEIQHGNKKLPFQDINTMDKDSIELLRLLYNLEIINGISNTKFAPDRKLNQAEAIIILQRLKGVLEGMRKVSFNISGMVQSYSNQEAIVVKETENNVLITITKQLPTPGYGIGVEKILGINDEYKIILNIIPPKPGTISPQVITYKTITIEIKKKDLKLEQPYVFIVEEIKGSLLK